MANPVYNTLKQYILRKLGSPIINIEITDDQLEDCIEEALDMFHEEHYDGSYIKYIPLQLTIDQQVYQLNDDVLEVVDILSGAGLNLSAEFGTNVLLKPFILGNGAFTFNTTDIVDMEFFRQQYEMVDGAYKVPIHFSYNNTTKKLYLHVPPTETLNTYLKTYYADQDDLSDWCTDGWVKQMSSALARQQWGQNLMKFAGATLPGGGQFNYSEIISMAREDIQRLSDDLRESMSLPPNARMA